jgi:hypothetical protein
MSRPRPVLGSELEQGFITRSVTNYLNLAGAVALAVWGWDLLGMRGTSTGGRRLRWVIWAGLMLSLVVLARIPTLHFGPNTLA